MSDVLIVDGARTPMGGLLGDLSDATANELGTTAIAATLERASASPEAVDEVFMGCVLPAGLKQCPARQAMLAAGVPSTTGAVTINKACGSGMQATIFGIDSIAAGTNQLVVSGGLESMSNAPQILMSGRKGQRLGHTKLFDHMFIDGLEDAYTGAAMGTFAQKTADAHGLTREGMDAFAIESLTRAQRAIDEGLNAREIAPVTIRTRRGEHTVSVDEQPHKANLEKIPQLRPAFAEGGTITPANSSSISDGASALLLASEGAIARHGLKPRARIVAHARNSLAPEDFTLAPIGAAEQVLAKAGWSASEVDLWEINEAFAMVTMLTTHALDLDSACVNVHGGAIALGHPLGCTGAKLTVQLLNELKTQRAKHGIVTMCVGTGQGAAGVFEML